MKKFIITMLIIFPITITVSIFWDFDVLSAAYGAIVVMLISLVDSVYDILKERKEKNNEKN